MLLDNALAFSKDQAITVTADSTNVLDTNVVEPDLGKGAEIGVMFVVKTSFANATSMTFEVYHGPSSADAILCRSMAFLEATLVKGFEFFLPLPKSVSRYLKVVYTVVGTHNAGTIDAYLTVKQ